MKSSPLSPELTTKISCSLVYIDLRRLVAKITFLKLEDELNTLRVWTELQKQALILLGDLNLNRLSDEREGKIFKDIENIYGLECLVKRCMTFADCRLQTADCRLLEAARL